MDFRKFVLPLLLCSSLTTALFSDTERGDHLLAESGGAQDLTDAAGAADIQGIPGILAASGLLAFSDFYALMPSDNPAVIEPGSPILFPRNGPTNAVITRKGGVSPSVFVLPVVGTYLIQFQASITEGGTGAAQLQLEINGIPNLHTIVGRAAGTDQVIGKSLVTTLVPNTTLMIRNPANNSTALTLTPVAGGAQSVSAHLLILRLR